PRRGRNPGLPRLFCRGIPCHGGFRHMWENRFMTTALLLIALAGSLIPGQARAARNEGGPTPPRLAFIDGEVSFWRPGAEDWAPAQQNTALAAGDHVYAGDGANFELEL